MEEFNLTLLVALLGMGCTFAFGMALAFGISHEHLKSAVLRFIGWLITTSVVVISLSVNFNYTDLLLAILDAVMLIVTAFELWSEIRENKKK